jgi:hypothetical protein
VRTNNIYSKLVRMLIIFAFTFHILSVEGSVWNDAAACPVPRCSALDQ